MENNRFAALKTNVFKNNPKHSQKIKRNEKKENVFKKQNNFKRNSQQENYRNKFMNYTDNYYEKEEKQKQPEKEFNLKEDDFPSLG